MWPRQYAILQLVLILSTALHLTGKYEYEHTTTTTGTDFNDVQVTVDIAHIDDDEEEDYQYGEENESFNPKTAHPEELCRICWYIGARNNGTYMDISR